MRKRKLTVIIPVYNEKSDSLNFVTTVLEKNKLDYLIIDDGSDYPIENEHVVRRVKNKGYGAAIKTGIKLAKGNYIAIIDADEQYDPVDLVDMWNCMEDEDMLIGRRITHQGGLKRMAGRIGMRLIASLACSYWIPDINSGLRIFKKNVARSYFSILCDEFSFTSSLTLSMVLDKCKVRWIPIGFYTRKGFPSTVKLFYHGAITLYQILRITIAFRTRKLRAWLRKK